MIGSLSLAQFITLHGQNQYLSGTRCSFNQAVLYVTDGHCTALNTVKILIQSKYLPILVSNLFKVMENKSVLFLDDGRTFRSIPSDQPGKAERLSSSLSPSLFSPSLCPLSLPSPLSDLGLVCTQCPTSGHFTSENWICNLYF